MALTLSPEHITIAEEVYERLKPTIEKKHFGHYIVIDPLSREYFIDARLNTALITAKNALPGRQFYSQRIGHKTVASFSYSHIHIQKQ